MRQRGEISDAIEECWKWNDILSTVYPEAAKRSIPCAPLLSLNGNTAIIAAAELLGGQAIYSLCPSILAQWQYGYHRSSTTPCL